MSGIINFLYTPTGGTPENRFVFTVKSDNAGTSASNQFTVPVALSGVTYNYNIVTSDGYVATGLTTNHTITFPSGAGTHTVFISGDFPAIRFANTGDKLKMLDVISWGNQVWESFDAAFQGCSNMTVSATQPPIFDVGISLTRCFNGCTSFNSDINNWNISNVTSINNMFDGASSFNQPLNDWDVSNVTNMTGVFLGATSFNQPLSNWNVSNVTSMEGMFNGATIFNQPLNNWDVSNVTNMDAMFRSATAFNQPLNDWNVSGVAIMEEMFRSALNFNQPLSNWNVSNVTNMSAMFRLSRDFNQDLGNWNVSNVNNFSLFMSSKTDLNYSATNLDSIYNNWSLLTLQPNLTIDFGTIKYTFTPQVGRDILTSAPNNWTIIDGGSVLPFPATHYYKFDNSLVDETGNRNLDIISGSPQYVTGNVGQSYYRQFSLNPEIGLQNATSINVGDGVSTTTPLSIAFSLKFRTLKDTFVIEKSSPNGVSNREFFLRLGSTFNQFSVYDFNNNQVFCSESSLGASLSINTWYNIILTFDGSGLSSGISMYLNNVESMSTKTNVGTWTFGGDRGGDFKLGYFNVSGDNRRGDVEFDEFVICTNYLFTSSDRDYIYNKFLNNEPLA